MDNIERGQLEQIIVQLRTQRENLLSLESVETFAQCLLISQAILGLKEKLK